MLAGRLTAPPGTLDLEGLARVLHLSAGVVRLAERKDGRRYRFRATGSAGGQFPFELYVAASGVDGLADGVHWFDPLNHALVQVGPAPVGEAATLVITGIPWRTGWRYAERGFHHLYWDAGAMLANILSVGEDSGLAPRLYTVFPDAAVARLVGADERDPTQRHVRECPFPDMWAAAQAARRATSRSRRRRILGTCPGR